MGDSSNNLSEITKVLIYIQLRRLLENPTFEGESESKIVSTHAITPIDPEKVEKFALNYYPDWQYCEFWIPNPANEF